MPVLMVVDIPPLSLFLFAAGHTRTRVKFFARFVGFITGKRREIPKKKAPSGSRGTVDLVF